MAGEVNPGVPEVSPTNYLGWSKAIQQPEAPKAGEYAYQTIGEGIKGGIGLAQFLQRNAEDDAIHQGVDRERGAQTERLESTESQIRSGVPVAKTTVDATTTAGNPPSLTEPPKEMPEDLKNLPSRIETLYGAKGNGRISPTDYYGRLDALASSIRARFPNDRDYIDEKFKAVSGVDAANKYMEGMVSDINSFVTSQQENKNKLITRIMENTGIPGAPEAINKVKSGQWSDSDVAQWMNPYTSAELQLKLRKAIREDKKGNRETSVEDAEDELTKRVSLAATQDFKNVSAFGNMSPKEAQSMLVEVASGKREMSDEDAQKLGFYLNQRMTQARLERRSDALEGGDRSLWNTLHADKANKIIEDGLNSTYGVVLANLKKGDFSAAARHMNTVTAMEGDDKYGLFNNKDADIANIARLSNVIGKMPQKFQDDFFKNNTLPAIADGKMKAWVEQGRMRIVTQDQNDPLRPGQPVTAKQMIEEAQRKGITLPTVYSNFVNLVEQLPSSHTPLEVKQNLAKAFFDPSNLGLISRFERESRDPLTNQETKGQYSVFNRMTSPDIMETMHKLGGDYWNNYKDWVKQSYGRELFGGELKDMGKLQDYEKYGIGVSYDPDNHRFEAYSQIHYTAGSYERTEAEARTKDLNKRFNRINNSLTHVTDVAKTEGSDVNAYVLKWMHEMSGMDLTKLRGVPADMLQALLANKRAEEELGEERRKKYKAPQ